MIGTVTGKHEFVQLFQTISEEHESEKRAWIASLRAQGFKAAHPNDGWVNREKKTLHLCYPDFDDGATWLSPIMLGWWFEPKTQRPVRLIEKRWGIGDMVYWTFEDLK